MKNLVFYLKLMKGKFWLLFLVLLFISISQYLRVLVQFVPQYLFDVVLTPILNPDSNPISSELPEFILWFLKIDTFKGVLIRIVILLITLQFIRAMLTYLINISKRIFGERIGYKLRYKFYDKLQKQSYDFHKKSETGDLIQRCTTDIQAIRMFSVGKLFEMYRIIFLLIVSAIGMVAINVELSLYSIMITPFIFLASAIYFSIEKRLSGKEKKSEAVLINTIQENLVSSRVVKAFARENYELEKFESDYAVYMKNSIKLDKAISMYWGLTDFLVYLQLTITVFIGSVFVIRGDINPGHLVSMYLITRMIIFPVRELGKIVSQLGRVSVSIDRVKEVLQLDDEYVDDGKLEPVISGNIEFKNVCFSFPDEPDAHALKNISFKINKGEVVAIVGRTGSGKSTLVNLLIKLIENNNGEILFDDISLKDISKLWIRSNVGVVLQDPYLYAKSIEDNIAISSLNSNLENVKDIARVACVHEDISAFNEGYDTLVGERGVTLSGGQKQRIAIARMLLENKPVLVFDDSLSAVDNKTDYHIREALKKKWKETTTIIITHRLSTSMKADKVIVLTDDGELESIGTHKELINKDGLYKSLWDIQTGKKVGDE